MALSEKRKIEIENNIEITGNFFIDSQCSYREIAEIFSNNQDKFFKASHVTIKSYIEKYKVKHPELSDKIDDIININKGSTIDDKYVLDRINNVYELLNEGNKFDEIAYKLNETYWTVYYDVHLRLRKIDKTKYNQALIMIKLNAKTNNKVK